MLLLLAGGIAASRAQLNLTPDVITFRTSGQQSQTTQHFGNLTISGSSSNTALSATNAAVASNGKGVAGTATVISGQGFGGYFVGGRAGVYGQASMSGGSGAHYGAQLYGSGSTAANYGAYIQGSGSTGSTNYGVYASASGGTTNWAGYFTGSIYVNGTTYPSDAKLKLGMERVSGALDKLLRLQPKTYSYDTVTYARMNLPKGRQLGLVAQELETVFPELVTEVVAPVSPEDAVNNVEPDVFKGINYTGLIPVLVAAIQEQQAQIAAQKDEIGELRALVLKQR